MSRYFVDLLTEGTAYFCKTVLRHWSAALKNSSLEGLPLRVCSYNVLCQDTAIKTQHLYKHLLNTQRSHQLLWEYRSNLLAREFLMISADILCLQEVQEDHFGTFYLPLLLRMGYKGEYKKRTGTMVDGCAIFYRPHFELINYKPIEYFVGYNTVLDRDNVGQLARFKEHHTGREFCVANTHLLFNRKRCDVKLAQLALLLAHIDKECGPESNAACPYIICGDFNMSPHSQLYDFLMSGQMPFSNVRKGNLAAKRFKNADMGTKLCADFMPSETNITTRCRFETPSKKDNMNMVSNNGSGSANEWTHSLQLDTAYKHKSSDGWPEVSSYSYDGAYNPDFIFYSIKSKRFQATKRGEEWNTEEDDRLRLIKHLTLPSETALQRTLGPWPNQVTPSDHVPLIVDFVLR